MGTAVSDQLSAISQKTEGSLRAQGSIGIVTKALTGGYAPRLIESGRRGTLSRKRYAAVGVGRWPRAKPQAIGRAGAAMPCWCIVPEVLAHFLQENLGQIMRTFYGLTTRPDAGLGAKRRFHLTERDDYAR